MSEADVWVTRSSELVDLMDERLADLSAELDKMFTHYKIPCDIWCPDAFAYEVSNVKEWAEIELWRRDNHTL